MFGFNQKQKHFGVDLVAKERARISSVLDGTVVLCKWGPETGHVIGIQHQNGYFSLYKHNSVILKSVGDFVSVGEHVAVIGNSGELSSGPHLHFELWHEGIPVNPEKICISVGSTKLLKPVNLNLVKFKHLPSHNKTIFHI